MKIAHVYDEHDPVTPGGGSVSKVVYNIAKTQSQFGHEVSILERQWSGLPRLELQDGIHYRRIPLTFGSDTPWEEIPYQQIKSLSGIFTLGSSRIEFALKLRTHFRKTDYDVVHFHVPFAANILIHIYPEIREKSVYTAHAGEIRLGLSDESFLSKIPSVLSPDHHLMRRVNTATVLNRNLDSKLPINDLEIISNGVDISAYKPENAHLADLNSEFGIERPFVLCVGTLTPRKGQDILLNAISILEDHGVADEFTFVMAGKTDIDGEFAERQMDKAEEINADIRFPGFVELDELKSLYSNCDIYVLPSREEGWGMVITEAMASKTPIVATNVSGIPEQVSNGENGYIIEPNNPKSLAEKLKLLMENRQKRQVMGEKSREIAVNQFSWEAITEEYLKAYPEVISDGSS